MFKIFLSTLLINILLISMVSSANSFELKVDGNKRISAETIEVLGSINKNEILSDQDLNEILKNLYDTNFFSDISISFKENILFINVVENPIIQSIEIKGVKKQNLKEAILDDLKVKEKNSFVEIMINDDVKNIINNMKSSGFFFVKVETTLRNNDNNTVDIIYNIDLGAKAHIGKIKFIGNKIFKDRKLRNIIVSEESKPWKFLSNKKYLNQYNINFDKKLLTNHYKNNGYYNISIVDSFAKFLDTNEFEIVYNINAGERHYFNDFDLILPDDFEKNNFSKIFELFDNLKGKIYSFNSIEDILDEIDEITVKDQFQFINASVSENIINGNKINFLIEIEETQKIYVQKINILGNDITREDFIRNQLIVDEGDPYNKLLHTKSINNLKSKNIFKNVSSKVKDSPDLDKKIIDITVEEKPTGEIFAGAGVGSSGSSFSVGINENNYMGTGTKLDTSFTIGSDQFTGRFSITKPNFAYSEKSLRTTIESSKNDKLTVYGFNTKKTGVLLGTSYEQYKDVYLSPNVSLYFESLSTNDSASANLKKQSGDYTDLNFSYNVMYDQRNSKYQPSSGFYLNFFQDFPVFTSNDFSLENGVEGSKYVDLGKDFISTFSFYTRIINSLNNEDVRVSKRVYLPQNRLRGFEAGKIGPVDEGNFIGGNYVFSANYSSTVPFLFPELQSADFKFFTDIGNVWGVDYSSTIKDSNELRSSFGLGVDWYTPIGPLSFSLASPISKASSDKTETFRFNIGTSF
jgi:outer membrane protein insertion porin family